MSSIYTSYIYESETISKFCFPHKFFKWRDAFLSLFMGDLLEMSCFISSSLCLSSFYMWFIIYLFMFINLSFLLVPLLLFSLHAYYVNCHICYFTCLIDPLLIFWHASFFDTFFICVCLAYCLFLPLWPLYVHHITSLSCRVKVLGLYFLQSYFTKFMSCRLHLTYFTRFYFHVPNMLFVDPMFVSYWCIYLFTYFSFFYALWVSHHSVLTLVYLVHLYVI